MSPVYENARTTESQYNGSGHSVIIMDESGFRRIDLSALGKTELTFGRNPQLNDIPIQSSITSARHGTVRLEPTGFTVTDLGSSNGTYISAGRYYILSPQEPYYNGQYDLIVRIGSDQQKSVIMVFTQQNMSGSWQFKQLEAGVNLIGRGSDCHIQLDHVSVSRRHADITPTQEGWILTDHKSTNGVIVNGEQLYGSYILRDKDILQITSSTMIFLGGYLLYRTSKSGIWLDVCGLTKEVGGMNASKRILDQVSCHIGHNEFVAIIGGSGSGKSTLMTAMSGFDSAVTGNVYFNGMDLHKNFSSLKNIIGFVPQQDIIYENLTLRKMLYYTAKMKMPEDTSKDEIEKRIHKILEMVELSEHQHTYIRKLSGGQKKRASIAVELLADPGLFFLDEPTSGLDPGTEQNLMHTLNKLSKSQGKTIVMVTHTTQNLHLCDKVIILGPGGKLCYCGSPDKAADFFGAADLVEVYNKVAQDSMHWANQFALTEDAARPVPGAGSGASDVPGAKKQKVSLLRQFAVLVTRYLELIKNDYQRLLLLFAQPLGIGLLLTVVASNDVFDIYEGTKSILFALTCSGIWIGLFNTIQEVCKERVILKREYMANLNLGVYIGSKYLVQGILCILQALILVSVFFLFVGSPDAGVLTDGAFLEMTITAAITIYASASMGLIISSLVKNGDRAMAVAPFVLIVQLLFSGILFELSGGSDFISRFTISRWSIEALGNTADLNELTLKMQEHFPDLEHEAEAMFERGAAHLFSSWGILFFFVFLFGLISIFVLRNLSKEQR